MKQRPILFKGEMVLAILDGSKIQTRRIMKEQPIRSGNFWEVYGAGWSKNITKVPAVYGHSLARNCPYGQVGDQLWVRETFGVEVRSYGGGTGEFLAYRASKPDAVYCRDSKGAAVLIKWIPSIHMPRWASRITLEITSIRIERLNDISEEDAKNEGVVLCGGYRSGFQNLWESINGIDSWHINPWVWVIEFKRVI